jgi:hypothetical protein
MNPWVEIISIDWKSASLGIWQAAFSPVKITLKNGAESRLIESSEIVSCARFELEELEPDCEYEVLVELGSTEKHLTFKTLPAPSGDMLFSYAVIADPHISCNLENRKGRLFVESAQIFREIVKECNELEVEFALVAGDLTNLGKPEEFAIVKSIMHQAAFPWICAPGDHDVMENKSYWNELMSEFDSAFSNEYVNALAVDTSNYALSVQDCDKIKSMLSSPKLPLILTHVHLLPNTALKYSPKSGEIHNSNEFESLFNELESRSSIIYAGHQNIPSVVKRSNLIQFNVPQTCQYPCCWYYVRAFENGIYNKMIPLKSEILRQYSRIDSELAADYYQEKQWNAAYRQGESPEDSNFCIPIKLENV